MPFDHFDKFELFTNSINNSNFTFLFHEFESPSWSIYHMNIGDIRIQYGIEGSGYIASGKTRPDGWFFYIQQSGKRSRINGQKLPIGTVFIVPPGYATHFSIKSSHEWISVFIPNDILNIHPIRSSVIQKSDHIVKPNERDYNYFIKCLKSHIMSGNTASDIEDVSIQSLRELIISSAKDIIVNLQIKKRYQGRKKLDRKSIIAKALLTINSTEFSNLDINKLVSGSSVSERTLRASFHEFFGISPVKYLVLLKLCKARHMIHDLENIDKTIVYISTSLGFWDQGRFAKRYELLFGELPGHAHSRIKKKFSLMFPHEEDED